MNLGIDPVHFGLVITLNSVIGLLTPPVGMVFYTIASVGNPLWRSWLELKWGIFALYWSASIDHLCSRACHLGSEPGDGSGKISERKEKTK